jgi:hypothetical protein
MIDDELNLVEAFKIGSNTFPNKLNEHLDLRTKHIDTCFCEHSELFAWYATAYELALYTELHLKEELARLYARADHKARMDSKMSGIKLTEKMVENTVITFPEYVDKQNEYFDSKLNTGLLRAAKDAMIHRRDMLIQMGATYRAEGQSDLKLKQQVIKGK